METTTEAQIANHFPTNEETRSKPDWSMLLGYLILAISAGLYSLGEYLEVGRGNDNLSIFFIHYFIAFGYLIILFASKSYRILQCWQRPYIHKTIILLNLYLVSAYALNRELPVFEDSVFWFCIYLILASATMIAFQYQPIMPKIVRYTLQLLLGSALVLYLYLAIYVANFYMVGTIGIILIGIGGHVFVPLILFYSGIRLIIHAHREKQIKPGLIVSGGVLTICIVIAFAVVWNSRVKGIDRLANQSVIHTDTALPVWLRVAQSVKNDWITERILKSALVYTVSNDHFQWDFFRVNSNWDEKRKHDPLVFLASASGSSSLSREDRKNILKALTDNRHRAQERLWAGDNLITSYIVTDVDIYPELHLAYSEQYLNIRNQAIEKSRWNGNSQEAIYTFQLPEGSVVTSLSLWINGQEEKAILTSKQKATEAYNTIVGRERRDPSVIHWQEGNTVSVRVFPCTTLEERKFKIGITSPLAIIGNRIVYKNVTFRGPSASTAMQTSRLRIIGNATNIELPDTFTKTIKGEYLSEETYDPDLTVTMDAVPVQPNQFSFDGFTYSLSNADPTMSNVSFTDIYLDLNTSWTSGEIESFKPLLNDYKLYVTSENSFIPVSPETWDQVISEVRQSNFSLFPFHHIKNTGTSLVVTKGKELSPYLRDFETSEFAQGISSYFASGKKVYVFNLEGETSTYIKSLKELRAFHFAQGGTEVALTWLQNKTFPLTEESDERVVLHESGLVIEKKTASAPPLKNNAPDHLARLFAYNNIMRQVGYHFFEDDFVNEKLVDEAATAYVVSPVSSLIVLETQEDYKRFGIQDKDNSLHNASKNSSGAVPEPHEWALIIVFLLLIVFQVSRHPRFKFSPIRK